MRAYVYEVIVCDEREGTERPIGALVISDKEGLDRDPYGDDNPRAMGSNEYLRPLYDGEHVLIHGVDAIANSK